MFNIGFSELVLILLVALVFVGPKDLPKVGAAIGRTVRKMKSYLDEFKEESGLDEAEGAFRQTAADVKSVVREADPTAEIQETVREIRQEAMQDSFAPNTHKQQEDMQNENRHS